MAKTVATGGNLLPFNASTGERYKGINNLQLGIEERGDPRWLTYKQAQAMGAQVRLKEKGTTIEFWKFTDEVTKNDANGKPVLDKNGKEQKITVRLERPRTFYASVFNAEQIDGLPIYVS